MLAVQATLGQMLRNFEIQFVKLSDKTVSERVHLLLLVIDVDQVLFAVGRQFGMQRRDLQILNSFVVEPQDILRLILQVLVLSLQLLRNGRDS